MGISSPKVGYTGYVASDTILQKKTNEYTTSSTTPTEVLTGKWIQDVNADSTIRWKAELKCTTGVGGRTYVYLYINNVLKATLDDNNAAYQAHEDDITVDWNRGDVISIRLKINVGGTAAVKNNEFCGDQSPVILN